MNRQWGNPEWDCTALPRSFVWKRISDLTIQHIQGNEFKRALNALMVPSPVYRSIMGLDKRETQ
jgi:hypothetical protein